MAIITVSRQLASLGDEISRNIAEHLGYKFFGRKEIERRIVELGFPEAKLAKFDEKKLGFFTGLTRIRDEYLNYLMTAILEAASENNSVIVGRGSFIILNSLENHVSCRFISDKKIRIERLQKELNCDFKNASKKITESENQQKGFYKSFFNFDVLDPGMYDLIVNTSVIDTDSIVKSIIALADSCITSEKDEKGRKKIEEMLIGQRIVNMLLFDYSLNINFLRISIEGNKIILHGIAESDVAVDSAVTIVGAELPHYQIESAIAITQDFKSYTR
ncbi:AAA family ATPase [Treponema sp.]|uniref:cytidylate kinase-like family protein n=1 Tax=Treponema sp. TaxID=166 RepID=UPI00388E2664